MKNLLKRRLVDFANNHIVSRLESSSSELIFQTLFAQQCSNAGLRNDFYPVGAAASYSLMYLLFRIHAENAIDTTLELGSGQSTLLIDRIRNPAGRHVCYEEDSTWHAIMRGRLARCDYRLRALERRVGDGISYESYCDVEPLDFDLLLVDGPRGVDTYSRFGCVDLIRRNEREDFIIVFDDAQRAGELQTIDFCERLLKGQGRDVKLNYLVGRTKQAVITSPKYRNVSFYY